MEVPMKLCDKIIHLRTSKGMSQEALAEKLSVSRQAVSKWEMGQAQPQIDNILQLCTLFSVSASELLHDEIEITKPSQQAKNKYFGTDGFRGEANPILTSMHAYKVGRFLGWYFKSELSGCKNAAYRPRIVIGKDTRRSSYMLEYSIVAGITASGADAYMLHVITTPGVSYVTRTEEFDCGIMITASHNPYHDNGIKLINKFGEKLDDKVVSLIEAYIDGNTEALGLTTADLPLAQREKIGCIVDFVSGRNRYVGYLISLASNSYKKLRIGLDCANGASWTIAKSVFNALGAQTTVIGDEPNGLNVNSDCGSTKIQRLCELVKKEHLDVGFAFDGEADRCFAVDEAGNVIDGDKIMYILANRLRSKGMLSGNAVVATVMSNSGFFRALKKQGIDTVQTKVGDRFVYEAMQNSDYSLGGEQSGHIILKKYATTGDGILTAIMLTEEMCDKKSAISKLCQEVFLYPQYTLNLKVKNKAAVTSDKAVISALEDAKAIVGDCGRILLRESGTEPLIRIMTEAPSEKECTELAEGIGRVIKERGHCID